MTRITDVFAITSCRSTTYTVGDVSFRMLTLPGMEQFAMGNNEKEEDSYEDEQLCHPRRIHPFTLAEYPVSQALWQAVYEAAVQAGIDFNAELLRPSPSYFRGPQRPVDTVSWDDAQEFCKVLNELLQPQYPFRLPSEAEWEYAAQAGRRDHRYAGSNVLAEVGWYYRNNDKETMPGQLLAPNAFGLYDMSGNVWEWCEDDWHGNYEWYPPDSRAWVDAEERAGLRVRRGGSWYDLPWYCRSAYRGGDGPEGRVRYFGFRLAVSVPGS
ncbi:MAG: formylglycine-generating enzyme family protein [Bacteroidota bacterium]